MSYMIGVCTALAAVSIITTALLYRRLLLERERLAASIAVVANMALGNTKVLQELSSKTVDLSTLQTTLPGFGGAAGKKN